MKKNKRINKLSILLYVVSILILIFVLFSFMNAYNYIREQIKNGMKVSENLFAIINYYMANCGMYFIYSLMLMSIGKFYHDFLLKQSVSLYGEIDETEVDDIDVTEFDEWNKSNS